jgi:isopenicillin N synthase-like dioxygenase
LDSDFSGLQVRHDKNNWINVGNKEGCIVVNTGDLMSIWTEGRMKSAVHRVLVPNAEVAKIHR